MEYSFLQNNRYCLNEYCLVPLREQDVELIRKWRNDQIRVLRQKKPLTEKEQHNYFSQVILKSFSEDKPKCILFSFLFKNNCFTCLFFLTNYVYLVRNVDDTHKTGRQNNDYL